MTEQLFLGIDLGGTKINTALMSRSGQILAQDYRETRADEGLEPVISRMVESVQSVVRVAETMRADIMAIGIGAPGPMEVAEGILTAPPNLPGWRDVPLKQLIQDRLGIQAFLENDANAAALAEYHYGAGQGCKNMIYVTVSTGIGGGLILGGELYYGSDGAAGEVGHMTILPHGPMCGCGNRGHLEALASGTAIAREGRELLARGVSSLIGDLAGGIPQAVTAQTVATAADRGDPEAQRIIECAMEFLGIGMTNLANIFNPDCIVIGGGLSNLGEKLFGPVRRLIKSSAFDIVANRLNVVPARLGANVGVIGAATVAIWRSARGK